MSDEETKEEKINLEEIFYNKNNPDNKTWRIARLFGYDRNVSFIFQISLTALVVSLLLVTFFEFKDHQCLAGQLPANAYDPEKYRAVIVPIEEVGQFEDITFDIINP